MTVKKKTTKKKTSVKKKATKRAVKKSGPQKGALHPEGYIGGRPTKYTKEMCERLIEVSRSGKCLTKASICVELDIDLETLANWTKAHKEFFSAIKKSEVLRMQHMEEKGFNGIHQGKNFNAVPWLFLTKNMFPKHYSDKKELAVDATDEAKRTFGFTLSRDAEKI